MFCDRLLDTLGAYVRGELDAGEAVLVEEHLADCPRCREETDRLRRSWEMLGVLKDVDPSITTLRAIRERAKLLTTGEGSPLRQSSASLARSRWIRAIWPVAASIALAVTGAGFWLLYQSPEEPAPVAVVAEGNSREPIAIAEERDVPWPAMTPIPLPRRRPLYDTGPLQPRRPATGTSTSTEPEVRVVRYSY